MIRRVAVIVPAANEELRIGRCLTAIAAARSHLYRSRADVSVQIFVVADGCSDATARIAGSFGGLRLITIDARSVGAARRAGARAALAAGGDRACELWLAHTDADSRVPADWLTRMAAEAQSGAHLVLGTVLPGEDLGHLARAEWLSRHHLRDGHPHVHGANFGIRGDSYLALGGWQPLRTGEDVDLAERATIAGQLRICRTASIPVVTSVRRTGRAPHGFSSYLRALGRGAEDPGAPERRVKERGVRVVPRNANDATHPAADPAGPAADPAGTRPAAPRARAVARPAAPVRAVAGPAAAGAGT